MAGAGTKEQIREFLAQRRIAVAGVSRDPQQTANHGFRRPRYRGCPVKYLEPLDPFHRCIRWILRVPGRLLG